MRTIEAITSYYSSPWILDSAIYLEESVRACTGLRSLELELNGWHGEEAREFLHTRVSGKMRDIRLATGVLKVTRKNGPADGTDEVLNATGMRTIKSWCCKFEGSVEVPLAQVLTICAADDTKLIRQSA